MTMHNLRLLDSSTINVNIKPSLLNTVDPVPRRQGHNPIGQAKMRVRNWLLCFLWHMAKLTKLVPATN